MLDHQLYFKQYIEKITKQLVFYENKKVLARTVIIEHILCFNSATSPLWSYNMELSFSIRNTKLSAISSK